MSKEIIGMYEGVSYDENTLLPEDMKRFRMATLRAKLASYGMYASKDADEELLSCMVNIAEQRAKRRKEEQKKLQKVQKMHNT